MTRLPEVYDGETKEAIEVLIRSLQNPANRRIPGDAESTYNVAGTATKRTLNKNSTADDVLNVLATLIQDLRTKGVIQ